MEKILHVDLPGYVKRSVLQECFEDQLAVVHLDETPLSVEERAAAFPMRLKASVIFLIISGGMDIHMNYQRYTLEKNTVFHLVENDIILDISHSPGLKADLLIFSTELRSEILSLTVGIRLPGAVHLKRAFPKQELTESEFNRAVGYVERIQSYIADESHLYRSPLIRNEVMNLLWNIDDSRWKKHGDGQVDISHGELLRERFREMLVENCRQHRDVAWYARELCVTPDYLSRVTRENDGQSAIKWIINAVIIEAKSLLRQQDKTVSEIAVELNFPDASTFGKFFKRQTNQTPGQYRKGLFRQ